MEKAFVATMNIFPGYERDSTLIKYVGPDYLEQSFFYLVSYLLDEASDELNPEGYDENQKVLVGSIRGSIRNLESRGESVLLYGLDASNTRTGPIDLELKVGDYKSELFKPIGALDDANADEIYKGIELLVVGDEGGA